MRVIAKATKGGGIVTSIELTEYNKNFEPIGLWLVKQGKISKDKLNKYFWIGLPLWL